MMPWRPRNSLSRASASSSPALATLAASIRAKNSSMFLPSGSVTLVTTSLTPATRIASTCLGVRLSWSTYLPVLTFVVSPSHIAYSRNQLGLTIRPRSASIAAIAGKLIPLRISSSTSLPVPRCGSPGYASARVIRMPATTPTTRSEPSTTISAVLNEPLDTTVTLTAPALRVEPGLKNERRGVPVDHTAPPRTRQICGDQRALGLGGGEPLVLLVQPHVGRQ